MQRARPVSMWALVVMVLVAALSVGGFFVVRNGVERQNKALLQNYASQIQLLLQSALQNSQSQLRSAVFFTISAGGSEEAFAQQAKGLLTAPGSSAALVDISRPVPRVIAAAGNDLHVGQPVPAPLGAFAARSGTPLSGSIVHLGSRTLFAASAAPVTNPTVICLETTPIDPTKPTPNRTGPYAHVFVSVYATPEARTGQLLLSTYGPNPLPPPLATARLKFASLDWLVVVAQKTPLAGAYAAATPWIVLAVGLLIAIVLALVVEILARRQRHSDELVATRTAELLEAQKVVVRQERLSAVGELAVVVSHELRNPLGAAINHLFLLRYELGDHNPAAEQYLADAERSINRAANLTEDLTAYMRERDLQISTIDFATLMRRVLESTPPPSGVEVIVDSSATFDADGSLMTQVVTNLVSNAYESMADGGALHVGASRDHDATLITVQDSGAGIDPEVASKIFDPFFTTKDGGTGLGLAIVQRMVALHEGQVDIGNVPGGGAKVTVQIPLRPPSADGSDGHHS